MLDCFRNGIGCIANGLNCFVRSLFEFFFARTDHHANDCAGKHSNAHTAHKTTAFHCITPNVVCTEKTDNELPIC